MQPWQRFGLAIGLCAAPMTSSAAPFAQTVYQLTINGGGLGYMDREVILFSRIDFGGAQPSVWIAERRPNNQQLRETVADHQRIDEPAPPWRAFLAASRLCRPCSSANRVCDCGNMVSRPPPPDGQEALDKAVCLALANNARFKAPLLPQEREGRFQWRANQ